MTTKERFFLWAHRSPQTRASRFFYMLYEIRASIARWWHKIDPRNDTLPF